MKQIKVLLTALIIIIIAMACGAGYILHSRTEKEVKIGHENLYSDNGYIDYAKEVYFDVETYPDMADMGLFWTAWDADRDQIALFDADSETGAALVDPHKPTIIFIHGMRSDGYYTQEEFYLNSNIADPNQFGLDSSGVPLALVWQNAGWNVGYFHYSRFATEAPQKIESKIWATDGEPNVRYARSDGSFQENPTEYCIAEHFAAEYLRAINMLPDSMGTKEIRLAAHSMGGELTTAGLFLLTVLSDEGQLDAGKLPNRFAMLDPYFSTCILDNEGNEFFVMGPTDITLSWSGKLLPYNRVGPTLIDCLKVINSKGIAVEYYTFDLSTLVAAMPYTLIEMLKEQCVYVTIQPDYDQMNEAYSKLADGHNGVRDWYLCSIYTQPVSDVTTGGVAASAATPTETIKSLRSTTYVMNAGSGTVIASDDTFCRTVTVMYKLNGGKGDSKTNVEIDTPFVLPKEPKKEGFVFDGWYFDNDSWQQPLEDGAIFDIDSQATVWVYAKWLSE